SLAPELSFQADTRSTMRKGLTFLQYAVECRRIAHQVRDPQHRERLEDMARAWESLAAERATHLTKAAKGNGGDRLARSRAHRPAALRTRGWIAFPRGN